MKYLLDTHVLLWSLIETRKLSKKAKHILRDTSSTRSISIISFWEISLKYSLGKVNLEGVLPEQLPDVVEKTGFSILPLTPHTAASFYKLSKKNKDPFDRMLAWQAITQGYVLLTKDSEFFDYAVDGLQTAW